MKQLEFPKAPRWINTEAGQWAWRELISWRLKAADAMSVPLRRALLDEAARLHQSVITASA